MPANGASAADAPLENEFEELYPSLFRDAETYKNAVTALAKEKCGMTRLEFLDALDIAATGRLSEALETPEASGFVRSYRSYGAKKKKTIYQLTDPFTLFHFRFLAPPPTDERFWSSTVASPAQATWRRLAFERLCLLHLRQIREALGVGVIHVEAYGWFSGTTVCIPMAFRSILSSTGRTTSSTSANSNTPETLSPSTKNSRLRLD